MTDHENSSVPNDAEARSRESASRGPDSWNLDSLPEELEYFRSSEAYQVELTGFQGPMDLLLHLINKEKVDIYDIPISRITDQFIRHIEVMQIINLETAGEFIAMAATLMVIKMKMLMPSHAEIEEDEEDPRAELVRKLLEYKRFKEAAAALHRQEEERQRYHLRKTRYPFQQNLDLEPELRIEMYDLLSALAGIFDRLQAKPVHEVEREPFTVEEKMSLIEEKIGGGGTVAFTELFVDDTVKMEVIVTFIAVLELVKRGRLEFVQTHVHGEIWIHRPGIDRDGEEDAGGDGDNRIVLEDEDARDDREEPADEDEDSWGDEDEPPDVSGETDDFEDDDPEDELDELENRN